LCGDDSSHGGNECLLEKTRIGPAEILNGERDVGIAFDIGALTVRRPFANWMPIGSCQVSPIRFECALRAAHEWRSAQ